MSLIESLPTELLYCVMSYINKIEDLKSICLTSKKLSALSTSILYRDLTIMDDLYNSKEMWQIVKEMVKKGKNLKYVKRLYVGKCSKKTADELDGLLAGLEDNSLHRFSYLSTCESNFPKRSQSRYICRHQKRICNLHCGAFFESILSYPPNIRKDFLSSITELSLLLSHTYNGMRFALPVWVMRIIEPWKLRKLELVYNMTLFNLRLASFFSIWQTPNLTHLSFVEYFFKDDEVDLTTMPNLTHLVFRDCYNMLYGLIMNSEMRLKSLELYDTNSIYRLGFDEEIFYQHNRHSLLYLLHSFKDLETIIIKVGIRDFVEGGCESLANAIQRYQKTLKILVLQYRQRSYSMCLISHIYLINAIKTCKRLSQLSLEVEPHYFRVKIDELIESLPDLTILYLVSLNMPDRHPPVVKEIDLVAKDLLKTVSISSKLCLLCFRTRLVNQNDMDNHKDDYVRCFFKSGVHLHHVRGKTTGLEEREPVFTSTTTQQALYLVRQSSIIRKLEPWLFQHQEPSRWFEE